MNFKWVLVYNTAVNRGVKLAEDRWGNYYVYDGRLITPFELKHKYKLQLSINEWFKYLYSPFDEKMLSIIYSPNPLLKLIKKEKRSGSKIIIPI